MYIIQILTTIFLSAVSISTLAQGTADGCGEVVTLKTHDKTTMRYALSQPKGAPAQGGPIALVLLPGGGGHANLDDKCLGSPASQMERITARTSGVREQVVTVTGGPDYPSPVSIAACEGRAPHGFVEQEAEVASGIARFVRGGSY